MKSLPVFGFGLLVIVGYVLKFVSTLQYYIISAELQLRHFIPGTTPFDRATGFLSRDYVKSVWRANNYHDKEKLPIEEADVPIRSPVPSKRVRTTNKYIEFTPTDIYKDIAQTTGE